MMPARVWLIEIATETGWRVSDTGWCASFERGDRTLWVTWSVRGSVTQAGIAKVGPIKGSKKAERVRALLMEPPPTGHWTREPNDDGTRFGTWYYSAANGTRWEVQRRTGEDDFGWYLFGPEGSPFGEFLGRRLGPSKLIAQDYAEDYPGARDWLRGEHDSDVYKDRVAEHRRW